MLRPSRPAHGTPASVPERFLLSQIGPLCTRHVAGGGRQSHYRVRRTVPRDKEVAGPN